MEVFVTGATGVIGRPVVRLLVDAGHRVRGLARSEANGELLRQLGAQPVAADLFDPASLRAAIAGCAAVLHLATRIPPSSKVGRPSAWADNDHIRRDGTRYLVDAALAAGVTTLIYPSVTLVYADAAETWTDEAAPTSPASFLLSTLAAEQEVQRFAASGGRGVVLRMAQFYGPGSSQTREVYRFATRGWAALFGLPEAYQSSIWVDDAARAVLAVLKDAPAGVYNVADDDPLCRSELLSVMARAVGRRRLWRLPSAALRFLAGPVFDVLSRSQRVPNRTLKQATGWAPKVPSVREGWPHLAKAFAGS